MRRGTASSAGNKGGFTLVELLIAMAVASLLMVSLLSILSKSMDVSKGANASMMSKASAQAALDLMVTDLDSLVVSRNAGQVLQFANGPLTNSSLMLLTTSMVDSYSSDGTSGNQGMPRLVQYVIQYATNFASSSNSFMLCRNVLEPANTFSNVIASETSLDTSWSTYALNKDPRKTLPNSYNNVLVPNVVAMNVNLYTNYGAGLSTSTNINSTNFPPGLVVEVALTVLDESVMPRFGSGGGSGNNSATNLIRQYGRTLIRRVALPSPP